MVELSTISRKHGTTVMVGVMAVLALGPAATLVASGRASAATTLASRPFGRLESGEEVALYTLTNAHGLQVSVTPWGATIVAIRAPDRNGRLQDVLLGFDSLDGYRQRQPFLGATVGRFGNRIRGGRFTLDGMEYSLPTNNGANHLHGGPAGFDKKLWRAEGIRRGRDPAVRFSYTSADGEQGYPGKLDATVTYSLTAANELRIDYGATTDKPTIVNLTNHAYFNLAGEGDVLGHEVQIRAQRFLGVDPGMIPDGPPRDVKGTPFDFTAAHAIGERVTVADEQLKFGRGYDHNWVLDGAAGRLRLAARVREPKSGRVMEVLTTEPGLQFYSGNTLSGTLQGRGGTLYGPHSGFCMETQHFPDSPNRPDFPSTTLGPGQRYEKTTIYRFSTD